MVKEWDVEKIGNLFEFTVIAASDNLCIVIDAADNAAAFTETGPDTAFIDTVNDLHVIACRTADTAASFAELIDCSGTAASDDPR